MLRANSSRLQVTFSCRPQSGDDHICHFCQIFGSIFYNPLSKCHAIRNLVILNTAFRKGLEDEGTASMESLGKCFPLSCLLWYTGAIFLRRFALRMSQPV